MEVQIPVKVGPLDPTIPPSELPKWRDAIVEMSLDFMRKTGRIDAIILGVGNPPYPDGTYRQSLLTIPINDMCQTHETKDALVAVLPDILEKMCCSMYVLVMDTFYTTPTPEVAEQYLRTGQMPKDVRRSEALMFLSEDIDGVSWSALYRYSRDEHGAVQDIRPVEELKEEGAQVGGRFTNLLRPRHRAQAAEA